MHIHAVYGFTFGLFVGLIYMIANDNKWRQAYNDLLAKYYELRRESKHNKSLLDEVDKT